MIVQGMTVTVEKGDGENELRRHADRKATVLKVIGPFAVIDIDGIIRGCLTEYLQPNVTLAYLFGHSKTQSTKAVVEYGKNDTV